MGLGTGSLDLGRGEPDVAAAGRRGQNAALEARLFARPAHQTGRARALPACSEVHQELKRPDVTLQLVWSECRAVHPTGYADSQFCDRYRRWASALKPSMRKVHRARERLFVDFSGTLLTLVDPTTGELVLVELFVGGCSPR